MTEVLPEVSTKLKEHTITVLLVDDQIIIGEAVRRMLHEEKDIVFHYCSDPSKAIQTASEIGATVILQDLVMPDIDGLTLVRYFRANPATKDIPLIVLSTKEEPKIKAEAFACGANDYMVKLPDKIEVLARIRYHSKGYISLLQKNEAYEKLRASQEILGQELRDAAEYVTSLLPDPMDDGVTTSWKFVPSTALGGDSFGYHWLDENHFAIYLLDVCGHGVGAALLSITAMNVLRAQTLPNTNFYDPAAVLTSLNDTFQMEKQNNRFFTMWYGVYDKERRILDYSSGGHPPAVLITGTSAETAEVRQLKTPGLVIGGMPDMQFEKGSTEVGPYNVLYVYSDGVYELDKEDGSILTVDEFIEVLTGPSDPNVSDVERMLEFATGINGEGPLPDDFSIVRVSFNA